MNATVDFRTTPLAAFWPGAVGIGPDILWAGSLLVALIYALRSAPRTGLDRRAVYWTFAGSVAAALVIARLAVLLAGEAPDGGGLLVGARSSFGGYLGGVIAGVAFARFLRLPVLRGADLAARSILVGEFVGRFGCLINGDDFGRPATLPFSVHYPPATLAYMSHVADGLIRPDAAWSLPVHPWPLYAALAAITIFAIAVRRGRRVTPGRQAAFILVIYGCTRLALAPLRGDVGAEWWMSSQAKWALAFALAGLALDVALDRRRIAAVEEVARAA
jgi:phosphatidylglycerol:prolipoprotein diacylglycerol transferase